MVRSEIVGNPLEFLTSDLILVKKQKNLRNQTRFCWKPTCSGWKSGGLVFAHH